MNVPDPLSALLNDFRFSGVSYGQCDLAAPWGIRFEGEGAVRLHLVVEGETWLGSANGTWEHLFKGDVVMLPRGPSHVLVDCRDTRAIPLAALETKELAQRVFQVTNNGPGRQAVIACCNTAYFGPALRSLIGQMPEVILVRANNDAGDLLHTLLHAMSEEVRRKRTGAATLLTRYADLIAGCMIREWAEGAEPHDLAGWMPHAIPGWGLLCSPSMKIQAQIGQSRGSPQRRGCRVRSSMRDSLL